MPDENQESKSTVKRLADAENKIALLEKAVKALLAAMHDVNDVTGRDCMPEGEYFGEKF